MVNVRVIKGFLQNITFIKKNMIKFHFNHVGPLNLNKCTETLFRTPLQI